MKLKKFIDGKKSQLIILKFMLAIVVFIFALIVSTPVKEVIETSTNSTSLNCSSEYLSAPQNATCVVLDSGIFYFLATIIAVGISMITGNRNASGIMTSIFTFILVVIIIEPLKDFIILFRDSAHLDCVNPLISTGSKLTCLVVDLWLFWVIALVLGAIATLIVNKAIKKD